MDATWVQLAIGLGTVTASSFIVRNGMRANESSDTAAARSEWWKRAQWAIDLVLSEDARSQEVGILAINELLFSPLAQESDSELIRALLAPLMLGIEKDDEDDAADAVSQPDEGSMGDPA